MPAFVDIHSHVLWGVDDGARDVETSIEMLRIAAENGTSDIVATPHSDFRYSFDPHKVAQRIEELTGATGGTPRIHTGCDFHLHVENIEDCLAHPGKYTINHLRYLMVEFSEASIPKGIGKVFEKMFAAGITPVITHPERNPLLTKNSGLMTSWLASGCLTQLTAQSFLGRFGKAAQTAAEDFVERGMAHFVASDAHDPVHRPPDLSGAFGSVTARYGSQIAERLFITNPSAVLTGALIERGMPKPAPARRTWFSFR
jgi:protein-tyrosine phosphatase